jgi:hypothetical protein
MNPTTVLFPKSWSREKLEEKLQATETLNGPLSALGHTVDKTAATFEFAQVPEKPLKLLILAPDGTATLPPDTVTVCRGTAWISGTEKRVEIVR